MTVAEAAVKYVRVHAPPRYSGPYKPEETPYMIEPQNLLTSRDHTSIVFCGPSQTGKTEALIINGCAYLVKCNPMDVILFGPSQSAARDFSKRRIDRMHRHSKKAGAQLLEGRHNDNVFDKHYKSGMMLTLSRPSINRSRLACSDARKPSK